MMPDGLHERLRAAAGQRTNRTLSELTDTAPETVRRYMTTHAPAAEFLGLFCSSLGINGDWLLTGRGPMKTSDVQCHALGEARAGDLLGAMAGSIEVLIDRVDRTEKFVQTLETRVRGGQHAGSQHAGDQNAGGQPERAVTVESKPTKNGGINAQRHQRLGGLQSTTSRAAEARDRARRIADAITGRPYPHAD